MPVFWTTIVIAFNVALWFAPEHYFGGLPLQSLRWAMLLVLIAGTATFLLLFWPLKRVEADSQYVYVTNYFKTARYSWADEVASIEKKRFIFLNYGTIQLNGKGTFGSSIRFLVSRKLLRIFMDNHPGLVKLVE